MGESFWQFRRYASHDSSSAIDWRQSAKSQHLFVREREWEAAQTVWFWRDASAEHAFQVRRRVPSAPAPTAAAGAGVAAGARRRAGGLYGHGRRARRLAPGADPHRPRHVRRATTRRCRRTTPFARGNQLVWFSDFLDRRRDRRHAARCRAPGVDGHLVRIVDPAEEDFPYTGRTRFESPRGGDDEIFGRAESVRDAYRARFTAHGEADRRSRHEAGLDLHRPSHRSCAAGCADRAACRDRRRLTCMAGLLSQH